MGGREPMKETIRSIVDCTTGTAAAGPDWRVKMLICGSSMFRSSLAH